MKLRNTQKATLFHLVESLGFDPAAFEFLESNERCTLTLRGTNFLLWIVFEEARYAVNVPALWKLTMCPGLEAFEENKAFKSWESEVVPTVAEWLRRVKDEVETPDPWAELKKVPRPAIIPADDVTNQPFTKAEWDKVRIGVDEIRATLLRQVKDCHRSLHSAPPVVTSKCTTPEAWFL